MNASREIPLLSGLSKVDLAKLIPNLEVISIGAGDLMDTTSNSGDAIYCIKDGWAEVVAEVGEDVVLLIALGPGESFGPLVGPGLTASVSRIRARTPLNLVRVNKRGFEDLCSRNPQVMNVLSQQLSNRITTLERELIRTKVILAAHARELWDASFPDPFEDSERQFAASAQPEVDSQPVAARQAPKRSGWGRSNGLQVLSWLAMGSVALIVPINIWFSLSPSALVLTVLLWCAVNWYIGSLPDYAVVLAMLSTLVIAEVAPIEVSLSGFTNETWFLILGIYGLAAAVNQTGLLYRFVLFILRKLPPTYQGQTFALAFTGLILTPILPSSNGRTTLASPLAQELATAMGLKPRSEKSAGLALSVLHGFGQMFFLFMNGTGNCLVVWALLPPEYRAEITWFKWLFLALPMGAIVFFGFLGVIMWMASDHTQVHISRRVLELQARTLGSMTAGEAVTLIVTVGVLLAFFLQPWHGFHPAWSAIIGMLVLVAGRVLDRNAFISKIDWASLVLFGGLWSLAGVIRHIGLDARMGQAISMVLQPIADKPWLFLLALGIITFAVRVVVPWESAIPLMMVAATPVLLASGYHPFVGGLTILATSNPFFMPQQNVVYQTVYHGTAEQSITHGQATRFGIYHAAVTLAAIVVSSYYWGFLGLIR